MSDLDALVPAPVELVVAGETLALTPLKVGQLPAFLRAVHPIVPLLTADKVDWLALFGNRGEDLLRAITVAVGKPREWVDNLAADEALLLAAKVIEVNADFFTRTVLPRLDGLFAQVNRATAQTAAATAGSTSSSS